MEMEAKSVCMGMSGKGPGIEGQWQDTLLDKWRHGTWHVDNIPLEYKKMSGLLILIKEEQEKESCEG